VKIFRIVLTGEEHPNYTITKAFQKTFEHVDTLYWDTIDSIETVNSIVQARVKAIKYDAVFMQIQRAKVITVETAKVLSEHSMVFNWTGDVRSDLSWYIEIAPYVCTLFTNMTDVHKLRKLGFRSTYLQTGYDDKYYFNTQQVRYNNIAFCGHYYSKADFPLTQLRADAVTELKRKFPINFNLYGNGWDDIGIKSEGAADNEWEALLYNKSSLALSISHFDYSHYYSDRLLRELACGACVLSHRFQHCEEEFEDGVHIVYWDNIEDLVAKTNYYMSHPEKARAIGNAAAEYVAKKHNWVRFTEKLRRMIAVSKLTKEDVAHHFD
jgi:hypothetical protein